MLLRLSSYSRMRISHGLVRKLRLIVSDSWYQRSANYSSQDAAREKKANIQRWKPRKEEVSPSRANAETAISKHMWHIKSSKTNFLYLLDEAEAKKFARLVATNRPPDSTAYTIEMNPGLGLLTRELLESGIRSIEMYEEVDHFWPSLTALNEQHPDRLGFNQMSLAHVMNVGYWDWKDNTSELDVYLGKVPKRSRQEEPAIEIIGSLSNVKFFKLLIGCYIFQNSLSKYGRVRLYVAVPPSVSATIGCDNKHYNIYRSWVVMFQTLFRHEYLGELSRSAFYPEYKNVQLRRQRRCTKIIRENDNRIMHVVKIEARADIFNDEFKESDIVTFYYFVHHHLRARTNRIIPALEHWLPGYGRSLIADGYSIFTEFGELMPDELLRLFLKFKSAPGFMKSSFVSSMSSFFLKMEEHFVFDDTTENIDEMFQSKLKEYEEKQKTKVE